jgi:predicted secreted hydrolase
LRLELIPESGPVWWRVDLGANYQAETVSYPRCQARGRLRLPSLDAAVSGSLSLEQVGSARSLRDAYRNLLSMRLSLPGGYRLALYSLSDHRGLRVLPQAFLVYPDGRLHTAHDVVIRVQDVWKSAVTRRYYGSKWSVESQALDLRAEVWTPTSAQEVPGLFGVRPYYFGAVRVEGRHRGQDFADVGMVAQEYRNQDALLLALSGR